MSSRLPEYVDPFHLAEKGREFKGKIPLSKMKRVASLTFTTEGVDSTGVQVEIQFTRDPVRQAIVTGCVKTTLQLQCQRCLESMDFPVDVEFRLGVVATLAEATKLPESYEPLVVEEIPMSLAEIIEDEILLALPAVAMHDVTLCPANVSSNIAGENSGTPNQPAGGDQTENGANKSELGREVFSPGNEDLVDKKPNPFAVLADLKDKLSK